MTQNSFACGFAIMAGASVLTSSRKAGEMVIGASRACENVPARLALTSSYGAVRVLEPKSK
jgi:hypothetical protein